MKFRHVGCCAAVLSIVFAASAGADSTVVVSPAGLGPWQSVVNDAQGNFITDTDATVSWGVNPPGAPVGTGSATLDTGTNHGDSAPAIVNQGLARHAACCHQDAELLDAGHAHRRSEPAGAAALSRPDA